MGERLLFALLFTVPVSAYAEFQGSAADSASAPSYTWSGDTNTGFWRLATGTIGIATTGTERIRINSSGVGIGTTSTASRLSVSSNVSGTFATTIIQTSTTASGLSVDASPATGYSALNVNNRGAGSGIIFQRNGTTDFVVTGAGNVGVGTGSVNEKMEVAGNLYVTTGKFRSNMPGTAGASANVCFSGTGYFDSCVSLRKYKTEIENLELGLDFLMKLRPVTYRLKNSSTREMGFIAEEMYELDPRFGQMGTNGKLTGVKYDKITSLLTKSVQELRTEKDREIASLREQVETMKAYICQKDAQAPFCK